MDNMNDMIGSLLNDPESMQQIKELAQMLKEEESSSSDSSASQGSDTQGSGPDLSALAGIMGAMGGASSGGPDLGMIAQIGKALSEADSGDKNSQLLLALRPHLSPDRQERVDRAVKMLRLWAIVTVLKDSGMLGKLL